MYQIFKSNTNKPVIYQKDNYDYGDSGRLKELGIPYLVEKKGGTEEKKLCNSNISILISLTFGKGGGKHGHIVWIHIHRIS